MEKIKHMDLWISTCRKLGGKWSSTWSDDKATVVVALLCPLATVFSDQSNVRREKEDDVNVDQSEANCKKAAGANEDEKNSTAISSNLNSNLNNRHNSKEFNKSLDTDHVSNSEGAGSSTNPGPDLNPTVVKKPDLQQGGARVRTSYSKGIRTVVTGPDMLDPVSLEGLVAESWANCKRSQTLALHRLPQTKQGKTQIWLRQFCIIKSV